MATCRTSGMLEDLQCQATFGRSSSLRKWAIILDKGLDKSRVNCTRFKAWEILDACSMPNIDCQAQRHLFPPQPTEPTPPRLLSSPHGGHGGLGRQAAVRAYPRQDQGSSFDILPAPQVLQQRSPALRDKQQLLGAHYLGTVVCMWLHSTRLLVPSV